MMKSTEKRTLEPGEAKIEVPVEAVAALNAENFMGISECLIHLVSQKASLQDILRNINQFALSLIAAEASTTWIRQGEQMILSKDTAYPVCYTRPIGGRAIDIKDGEGVTLTSYMAYQFAHHPELYPVFNFSYATIVNHYAYGGGVPAVPFFPRSRRCHSMLVAPIRRQSTNEFIGLIKIDNKLSDWGFPCGDSFSHSEVNLLKYYVEMVATKILSDPGLDLSKVSPA
jgi:hypothetical protein